MTQPNQPQEIKIADNIPGAEYTNMAQINHNKEEFMIMFANVLGLSGKVVSKIITSPGHFKRLLRAMQDNLKKYEENFGVIKEAPEMDKEIGFNEKEIVKKRGVTAQFAARVCEFFGIDKNENFIIWNL